GTVTAALTTGLAFYAAMLADFTAVAELGWIAGSGVLLCALACFTVLPAVLTLCDRKERRRDAAVLPFPPSAVWLPGVARRHRLVLLGGGLAVLAVAAGAARVAYDHNLLHLQDQSLDGVKWEQTLIEHTAGASWNALSIAATPERALELKRRY